MEKLYKVLLVISFIAFLVLFIRFEIFYWNFNKLWILTHAWRDYLPPVIMFIIFSFFFYKLLKLKNKL